MNQNYFSGSLNPKDITLIAYHDRCPDGAASAFCAFSVLGDSVQYLPCSHGQLAAIFENAEDNTILFLDFSLKRETFIKLQGLSRQVSVLDHHLTAQSELQGLPNIHINLEKCGASLAWEFFNPGQPQPKFITYVEDVDLWHWKQKDSYYFSLGFHHFLRENKFNFKTISNVFSDEGVASLITKGHDLFLSFKDKILNAYNKMVAVEKKHKDQTFNFGFIELEDDTLVNDVSIFTLKNQELDCLVLYYKHSGHHKFSLRRLPDNNKIAMHKIAEHYLGGGHAYAASFFSDEPSKVVFDSIIDVCCNKLII